MTIATYRASQYQRAMTFIFLASSVLLIKVDKFSIERLFTNTRAFLQLIGQRLRHQPLDYMFFTLIAVLVNRDLPSTLITALGCCVDFHII